MKFALFLVLSLSAMAFAGPAFNKNNQIQDAAAKQQQQQQYMTTGAEAKSPAIEILKQWCFSSQMSQQELTGSFKKLVAVIKSNPIDQITESAVMSERICQGALVAKSQQTGETLGQSSADAQAHELIKDVYMDAMISCKSHECQQQLLKIVKSGQVDSIRASYYMTRIAVTDKSEIKSEQEIKQLAESFLDSQSHQQQQSEAVERQQLFATTSLIGKWINEQQKSSSSAATTGDVQQVAEQVAKKIVERYVKRVSQQEVEQYKQTPTGQQVSQELAKKIAKRGAALKALANIPGHVLKKCPEVEQVLVELAQTKSELSTVRQSAIECLEQNDKQIELLKQLTFAQEEPIEVRIAAYRALMTSIYTPEQEQQQQHQQTSEKQQQIAREIVAELVKHCEQKQQQDEQFCLYVVSHLDNVRTSQQAELAAIKETIKQDKQHNMQIQLLAKQLKSQLSDVRRSSRNYKLEQEFAQLESGLVLEGDILYSSENTKQQMNSQEILPKLVRVNMSMPIMGETVNVVEITLRQDNMDAEILSALKLVQNTKFNQQTVSKVVDSFKQTAEKYNSNKQQQQQGEQAEADLTIKVDGQTVVFVSLDDFKYSTQSGKYSQQQHQRNTRSVYSSGSLVDEIISYLKRQPVSFNRGFNFNIQERIAKVLDIDANIIAGLRFESRAQGVSSDDFEIVAQMEPRASFEAITGPAKLSSKKLMQRFSTKTALGLRLRFKSQELVDVELELPMNTMELFTFETQLVEKSARLANSQHDYESYNYLPESIYGQETDIYSSYPIYSSPEFTSKLAKRSIVPTKFTIGGNNNKKSLISYLTGKSSGSFSHSFETSKRLARATGLQGKLRMIASPKDMSLLVSCIVEKHDQQMRGLRVKLEQSPAGQRQTGAGGVKSYTLTMSTPGSSIERTMQVRLTKQSSHARTLIKSEIVSPFVSALASAEFVHDGRQYSVKAECVSRQGSQWRHAVEFGVVSQQQQQSRIAGQQQQQQQFAYKPYLQVDSSALKRPFAMQGQVAYVQSPKTVISYELKCSAGSGTYVSGKLTLDARDNKMSQQMRKRSSMSFRRSMQSPLELIAQQDLTIVHEFAGQLEKHAVKVRQVLDWDCQKYSLEGNSLVSYKNRITQKIQELVATMKVNEQQQVFTCERKCPTDSRKQWNVRVVSLVRPSGHEMQVESHFAGRRASSAIVAYKHKIDIVKTSQNAYECAVELELVDSEHSISEKAAGRVRLVNERKHKQCQFELAASRGKSCKLAVDYESLAKHVISFAVASERFAHKTELRNNERQIALVSRTDKPKTGEQLAKLMVDIEKQQPIEAKIVFEIPVRRINVACDLSLASGKRSSVAVQTGRYSSQAEFSFELKPFNNNNNNKYTGESNYFARLYPQFARAGNLRFRSNLKDLKAKQAYWMESQLNGADSHERSFMRVESPFYRSEFEFSPRSQEAKLAAYARSQPSSRQLDSIYRYNSEELDNNNNDNMNADDNKSSLFEQLNNKLALGPSKMWMVRSIVSSPFARDQLKKQARRALFEYADRRAQHKHSFVFSPEEQRVQMELAREPNTEFTTGTNKFQPMRFNADLSGELSRPSTMSLDTEWMSADVEAKPFAHCQDENEDSFAKIQALSRVPRSTGFKKHESELRYNKKSGYKAHMKHVDSRDQRHELRAETGVKPSAYSQAAYESDKHGKMNWEHKWRHEGATKKRSTGVEGEQEQEIYANRMWLKREGPQANKWQHETKFDWEEPTRMIAERRYRRSIFSSEEQQQLKQQKRANLFSSYPIEYLKNTNARLVSTYSDADMSDAMNNNYKLDFDYQPMSNFASMHFEMPDEMSHVSHLAIKPVERSYKLASKLYNRRTNEPSYELLAASKPYGRADLAVEKLATSEQEPVFVHSSHPMLERPISTDSILYSLFKQPMKLDYSDKYGRVANFDYDQLTTGETIAEQQQQQQKFAGLRQKRAALFYKDPSYDIEHSSSYDFYPESFMTKIKPAYYKQQQQQMSGQNMIAAPVAIKTSTKYGPIVVRADSSDDSLVLELESPLVSAKLVGEQIGSTDRKLYKIELDNESQRVQLAKLVRDFAPEQLRESKLVKKFVRKFDSNKFDHQTELIVDLVEQIYKIKSSSKLNGERPIVEIEGEWNEQSGKAFAKINGERVDGQCIVDLVRKTADLTVSVDAKRTLHHVTRLVKTGDKFYALESMTSYKSRPLVKLTGKLSANVFDLEHLMSHKQTAYAGRSYEPSEHVSTFDAIIYEPKEYHVAGQFDCDKKVARVVIKNVEEKKVQETQVSFAPETETIYVQSSLVSQYEGQIYSTKAKLSLPGLMQSDKCMSGKQSYNKQSYNKYVSKYANEQQTSCKSEIVYSDNKSSGVWAAQYYPGEYVTVSSPRGKTTFNLAY